MFYIFFKISINYFLFSGFIFIETKKFYIMANLIKAAYPCSQKDLYSVLETAWGNYGDHLASFTAFKALYTAAFKTSALSAIASARALPDDDARSGESELLRIDLVAKGKLCLQHFQFLKSYIDSAFADPEVQQVQYVIAGQNNYRDASRQDWESLVQMNSSAKNYLADAGNVAALTAGNNMPAGFVATQKTASDNFDVQYAAFKMAEQTSVETANKINANNLIFAAGMSMLNDGQKIFMNSPEVLTKFVFGNLLALINPPVAGIKGTIKEAVTNAEIVNGRVVVQREGEPAVDVAVDVNGDFAEQLMEGEYKITVGADGYVEQIFNLDLKLTGLKTLNVDLVKV